MRDLYAREGGAYPAPIAALDWWYSNPASPSLDEVAKEINGWALEDVRDAAGTVVLRKGQQLARFTDAQADGTTASGNWLYIGMYTDAGNLTQRRSFADPSGLGRYPEWGFSWPANRRILYNRCSADGAGQPWDASRVGIEWNGTRWTGDVPDFGADSPPEAEAGAFLMLPEGAGPPVRAGPVRRRTVVGALRAGRVAGGQSRSTRRRAAIPPSTASTTEHDVLGTADRYPIVCTTYRLTEHFHYWTKNNPYSMQLQPEFFVEISEELASREGDRQRRSCARDLGPR